jgi:hypothetical protein
MEMLRQLQEWSRRRAEMRAARADREVAGSTEWAKAEHVGDDGLTNFERDAISALEPITGPLSLVRASSGLPVLRGSIPNTRMTLHLYADEAQVHGLKPAYRRERWDFNSPQDSISDLVNYVRNVLQPNISLQADRER